VVLLESDERHVELGCLGCELGMVVLEEQRHRCGAGLGALHVGGAGVAAVVFNDRFGERRVQQQAGLGAVFGQRRRVVALDQGRDRAAVGGAGGVPEARDPEVDVVLAGGADVVVLVGVGFGFGEGGGDACCRDGARGCRIGGRGPGACRAEVFARAPARAGPGGKQHHRRSCEQACHRATPPFADSTRSTSRIVTSNSIQLEHMGVTTCVNVSLYLTRVRSCATMRDSLIFGILVGESRRRGASLSRAEWETLLEWETPLLRPAFLCENVSAGRGPGFGVVARATIRLCGGLGEG